MELLRFLEDRYVPGKLDLSIGYTEQLYVAIRSIDRWHGTPVSLSDLSERLLTDFMKYLRDGGLSPNTINGRKNSILTLWRAAHRQGLVERPPLDVPSMKRPKRLPTAWTVEEFGRILAYARMVPTRRGWTSQHWVALLLTCWDSAARIGALLRVKRSALDFQRRQLKIPAELQKGHADTLHELHVETVESIRLLPEADLLFDWPWQRKDIQRHFRERILKPAGLPAGRRDLFHRIRRTSFSIVYSRFGLAAAMEHAAHTSDLSRYYLAPEHRNMPRVLEAIPRPPLS